MMINKTCLAAMTALMLLLSAPTARAAPGDPPQTSALCSDDTPPTRRALQGRVHQHTCAVDGLERHRFDEATPAYGEVRQYARSLADFYASRAGRQQAMIDGSATATGLGALGYAFSEPAGTLTRNYWGYAALLSVIVVEFNANEPTRDLYFAGRIGSDLVTSRYALLESRITLLAAPDGAPAGSIADDCDQIRARLGAVSRWPDGDHKAGLLPVLVDLATRCGQMRDNMARGAVLKAHADAWRSQWARSYAEDLLQLDRNLTERDFQLRTSPAEALTLLVSTPLRRIDTLVSGENTQAALDALKVQNALGGLGFDLTPIALPEAPALDAAPFAVPAAAQARIGATLVPEVRRGRAVVSVAYDPGETARWIADRIGTLEARRLAYNERARLLQELRMAARRDQLEFAYNTTSHKIDVALREPAPLTPSPAAVR